MDGSLDIARVLAEGTKATGAEAAALKQGGKAPQEEPTKKAVTRA